MSARYWVGGGSSSNWSATGNTNWSATSGGANNASIPGSGDDVYFNGAGTNGNTANTVSAIITVNSVTYTSGYTQTTTINAALTISGTLDLGTGSLTFAGTSGWTCGTLSQAGTAAATITLKDAIQYIINSALNIRSANINTIIITSASGSVKALLRLVNGATCNCMANFTRIDATGGRTITTFNGTITDCVNIAEFHDIKPVAGAI